MKLLVKLLLTIILSTSAFAQDKTKAVFTTEKGAINGFDPVAYFTESKPVIGKKDITYKWNNATWHFSSKENMTLFKAKPNKYAPQYGGWCAFGWSRGYPAKIEADAWSIVNGKLYLNYNKEVQETWSEKKEEFIIKADKNYKEKGF
ncbi:YHS domain-containing (seleno)protein [Wenyingzhuangia marina]|uniref:YHS domain-containing protein n=1 Tax=Wenyingzhuangia marina TaxID=1195760 RepID=A0A1M5WPK5_9FLAO|nr:YHS domain-containing (seleno)protein [Wenyingzhuangia marina]GGF79464.1 hypothetical protein GCM10011397_23140 [Wenyingzhuangia marina]SHH88943.1 hypothetical protein SAMN05444281_2523 [Wenyingzhuangia marina]